MALDINYLRTDARGIALGFDDVSNYTDAALTSMLCKVLAIMEAELCQAFCYEENLEHSEIGIRKEDGNYYIQLPRRFIQEVVSVELDLGCCNNTKLLEMCDIRKTKPMRDYGYIETCFGRGGHCSCTNSYNYYCDDEVVFNVIYHAGFNPVPEDLLCVFWGLIESCLQASGTQPGSGAACEADDLTMASNKVLKYKTKNEEIQVALDKSVEAWGNAGTNLIDNWMEKTLRKYKRGVGGALVF